MLQSSQRLSQCQGSRSGGKKRRSSLHDSQPQSNIQRRYIQCPICTAQIPAAHLDSHVEDCATNRQNSNSKTATTLEEHGEPCGDPEEIEELGEPCGEPVQHDEEETKSIPCAQPSAFDLMMERQRKNNLAQVFFLEHSMTEGWRWHWTTRGKEREEAAAGTEIKWSSNMSLGEGGGRGKGRGKASEASSSPPVNVLLATNIPSNDHYGVTWTTEGLISNSEVPPEGRWQGGSGYSVMKSALQKAVRLGRAPCAVRILFHLFKDSPQEALRRMPVIVVEDAILHPSYPFLIWLMAAQGKGYQLSEGHVNELLRIAYEVSSVKIRDFLPPTTAFDTQQGSSLTAMDKAVELGEDGEESVIVRSILLRASFGGLQGDVKMLKGYASYWASRFLGRCDPPPSHTPSHTPCPLSLSSSTSHRSWLAYIKEIYSSLPPPPPLLVSVSTIGPLRLGDIPISSIDYHVSNVIEKLMEDQRVTATAREITRGCWGEEGDMDACLRSAMWLFRSSVNVRRWVAHEQSTGTFSLASSLLLKQSVETLELEADLERDAAKKERLAPLWEVARQGADSFAVATIKRRFS